MLPRPQRRRRLRLILRLRYTRLVPRAAYTSLNDAFFDYANASGLPLPRRPLATGATGSDSHQLQLSTTATTSRSLGGANTRCRYFVSDELGMTADDAKKQGTAPPLPPPPPFSTRPDSQFPPSHTHTHARRRRRRRRALLPN